MAVNFNATSGNKTSSNKTLKRMEFIFNGKSFKFLLNPESYTQQENGRVSLTQTKGGAFLEAFGAGIIEISMSGTTGYKNGTNNTESGYKKFKELRDLIKSVYNSVKDGSEIKNLLEFYNYTDNEYYYTYPDKFKLLRNKQNPLLYRYEIHLYCIRRIGEPAPNTSVVTIGNPIKAENTQ
jgi:hypothetical protein